jgi:hypothetical protein
MVRATAAPHAPWYVVPADRKWFTRLVVAAAIHAALDRLDLAYPKVDAEKKKELAAARAVLVGQDGDGPAKRVRAAKAGKTRPAEVATGPPSGEVAAKSEAPRPDAGA